MMLVHLVNNWEPKPIPNYATYDWFDESKCTTRNQALKSEKKWITLIVLSSEECILLCNRTYKNTILKKAISELRYKYFHTCLSPAGTRLIKVGRFMINACLKWTNRQLASGECQHQTLLIWSLNENMNKWSYSTSPWNIWECLSRLKWMIYSITFVLEILFSYKRFI